MLNEKKYIIIYVNYKVDFDFFKRFVTSYCELGYGTIFITNKVSIALYAKKLNIPFTLVKKYKQNTSKIDISNTIDILNNWITIEEGEKYYFAITRTLEIMIHEFRVEYIFIFNGNNIHDLALLSISDKYGIKKIFFELSNIPNKMFIDQEGTNAKSSIFRKPELVNKYVVIEEDYNKWKQKYIKEKLGIKTIPQAKTKSLINNPLLFIDELAFVFFISQRNKREKYFKKIYEKLFHDKGIDYDSVNLLNEKYVFYPMQIENDTQIKIHSKINNYEAIRMASQIARRNKYKLFVKLHPANIDIVTTRKVFELKEQLVFDIVNESTTELLLNAEKIITINSTVGLEGLILEKNVEFLGESLFSKLNSIQLKKYIMLYLIKVDYFSSESITIDVAKLIIERANNRTQ